MARPIVHVIAGPNGAGKTTFARVFLAGQPGVENFLNADLMAAGLSPLAPGSLELRAGRLLLERWHELAGTGASFAVETTMSGKTYARMLIDLKSKGYEVRIFYLWLNSVSLSLNRIQQRVLKGGHNVPQDVVRRRSQPSLSNFFEIYLPLSDIAVLFDASEADLVVVARFWGDVVDIKNEALYDRIKSEAAQ